MRHLTETHLTLYGLLLLDSGAWAIPENREFQKWKLSFFPHRHTLSTSFNIFVITYRVTNFLPKLVNMLLFSMEKTEFPFLVFPYFQVMPVHANPIPHKAKRPGPQNDNEGSPLFPLRTDQG